MRKLAIVALSLALPSSASALPELTLGPTTRPAAKRFNVDRVIAVVGGIPIFSSQLAMLLRGSAQTQRAKPAKTRQRLLRKAARETYQCLLDQALVEAAGARAGERVSDDEVRAAIERWVPRYWASREQAAEWGMSDEEYDRSIRVALLEQRLFTRYLDQHPSIERDGSAREAARKRWLAGLARTIRVERRLSL